MTGRARRLNQGVFISGASGSGKSRMTERLAAYWRRAIYADPMGNFNVPRVTAWEDAATSLASFWKTPGPIRFAVTFRKRGSDEEYRKLFAALATLMETYQGNNAPFLFVADEVDFWSGPKYIDPHLSYILRYGRHFGCSWIANCRADVHTNRDVRMNATETLIFRQGMLSPDPARMVAAALAQRDNIPDWRGVERLVPHAEAGDAVEYQHFLAVPEPFEEWLPTWKAVATAA